MSIERLASIYLNDHLAGATAGVELARRLAAGNQEIEALAATLRRVSAEIEADRETLEGVLERLDVSRSPVKPHVAWLLERQDSADTDSDPELYRTRLAALDQMAGAAREAVYDAPHDPVINSYYINTLAAREVTLKQLNASLGGQVNRF